MAARPTQALRTLAYGKRLAENQIERLRVLVDMADATLQSKTLSPVEIENQLKMFSSLFTVDLTASVLPQPSPLGKNAAPATPKKRGRPPKASILATEAENTAPKKRGRPPKAVAIEAPAKAPKSRAPKAQVDAATVSVVTPAEETAPKKRGRPPKAAASASEAPKRRGRPKGSKNKPKDTEDVGLTLVESEIPRPSNAEATGRVVRRAKAPVAQEAQAALPQVNTAPLSDVVPQGEAKRGPGRPKGSKNKPKLLNGQNAAA